MSDTTDSDGIYIPQGDIDSERLYIPPDPDESDLYTPGKSIKLAEPETPMADKWAKARPEIDVVRNFLEFLRENGMDIYGPTESRNIHGDRILAPTGRCDASLIYQFFQIDPQILDDDRRAMLDWVRSQYEEVHSDGTV